MFCTKEIKPGLEKKNKTFCYKDFNGSNHKHSLTKDNRIEATKKLIKETFDVKTKSPMDDFETAKKWLSELSGDELKHAFIRDRAEKVRKLWGL
jgi:hypothetical protein